MHNLFLLLGTIIGAGIFSLPIALSKSSFWLFLIFTVLLGYVMAKVNWFYRQIVNHTRERHQLGGYVRKILGLKWSFASTIFLLFSTVGALLAYLILAGDFLAAITPLGSVQGTWLFYLLMFVLLYFGGRHLEALDVFMTVVKVILLAIVIIMTFNPAGIWQSLGFVSSKLNIKTALLAYGSVLFAMSGYSIVPELKNHSNQQRSINLAQIIVSVFYLLFSLNLLSFVKAGEYVFDSGLTTVLFNLTGFFSVLTPYLMLSWVSYDLFDKDLGFGKKEALVLTLIIPLLFYLMGLHDFLTIISVSGGVFLGGIAMLIAQMYKIKFPGKETRLINIIQLLFGLGAIAEIITLF